jgi:hypothetical protein
MDDFYFSKNTTMLIETEGIKVGSQSLKQIYMDISFKREIDIDYKERKRILGISVLFDDRSREWIVYQKLTSNYDLNN